MLADLNTIKSQREKLHDSYIEAQARQDSKLDSVNASIVAKIKGLASYGVSMGTANAGVRYLLGECQDFDKAAGNFELRQACYNNTLNILEAITPDHSASEPKESLQTNSRFTRNSTRCQRASSRLLTSERTKP